MKGIMIICLRKEDYVANFPDNPTEKTCGTCKQTVLVGESVIKDANSDNIKFICMQCLKENPKFGKLHRTGPNQIKKIREHVDPNYGEKECRHVLKTVRNLMGSKK